MDRADYVQACVREVWPRWVECVRSRSRGYQEAGRGFDDSSFQIILPTPRQERAPVMGGMWFHILTLDVPVFRPVDDLPSTRVLWCGLTAMMRDALDQQGWPDGVREWSVITDFPAVLECPIALPVDNDLRLDIDGWPPVAEGLEMILGRYSDLTPGRPAERRLGRDPFVERLDAGDLPERISAAFVALARSRPQAQAEISGAIDELVGRMAIAAAGLTNAFVATGVSASEAAASFQAFGRDLLEGHGERQVENQRIWEEFEPGETPRLTRADADDLASLTLAADTQGHDLEPALEARPASTMTFAEWRAKSAQVLEECGHRSPTEEERQHDDED